MDIEMRSTTVDVTELVKALVQLIARDAVDPKGRIPGAKAPYWVAVSRSHNPKKRHLIAFEYMNKHDIGVKFEFDLLNFARTPVHRRRDYILSVLGDIHRSVEQALIERQKATRIELVTDTSRVAEVAAQANQADKVLH